MNRGVTREAVTAGFERFIEEATERTAEEFSVARALREGTRGPGGRVVDRLLKNSDTLWRKVVQPELDGYREQILAQFEILLDAVEDGDVDAYREELLAADSYNQALREELPRERRERIREELLERQRRFGTAVEPILRADEDEFWPAVRAALDRDRAEELVEEHFAFTRILREERSAFRMSTRFEAGDIVGGGLGTLLGGLPTVEVEYTDEAMRSMRRAERAVISNTLDELGAVYDGD